MVHFRKRESIFKFRAPQRADMQTMDHNVMYSFLPVLKKQRQFDRHYLKSWTTERKRANEPVTG